MEKLKIYPESTVDKQGHHRFFPSSFISAIAPYAWLVTYPKEPVEKVSKTIFETYHYRGSPKVRAFSNFHISVKLVVSSKSIAMILQNRPIFLIWLDQLKFHILVPPHVWLGFRNGSISFDWTAATRKSKKKHKNFILG